MERPLRTPILSVLGHIDHGKTTLLDSIRGTAVAAKEAGGVTQHIGATEIPIQVIKEICEPLKSDWTGIELPGLLFIDTPGHYAFASLRKRGSALADVAVLVVDVMEGFQPQTYESLSILRLLKTPFVVALNKIDRIKGWQSSRKPFIINYQTQPEFASRELNTRIYEIVGDLYDKGFSADRYDRISDFSRTVSIVPVSAKTGEGIADLLLVLIGLAQKYFEKSLRLHLEGPGVGTILEKKEERGLGTTIDVILYDGKLSVGDTIVVGSAEEEPIVTKIRALLKPRALQEIRTEQRFRRVKSVSAAAGVKIMAPNIENALPGSRVRAVPTTGNVDVDIERVIEEMKDEIAEMKLDTSSEGLIIKADTMGSLEALALELRSEKIEQIKKAEVGNISKRDVVDATMVNDRYLRAILGFNVDVLPDAREVAMQNDIPLFVSDVIYRVIEDYENWVKEEKERERQEKIDRLTTPAKIKVLPGCVFRQSKPAIFGIEVLCGRIKTGVELIKSDGTNIGSINEIQNRGESIATADEGMQVAISMKKPTFGRQIKENEILYVDVDIEEMNKLRGLLSPDEEKLLTEVYEIKTNRRRRDAGRD
ncbi:MAG: translation initiation factor IF-2 [Methanophagales archaeon]|nr:translation initiation factor IF-2 [Methanophagales archaeon]MCW7073277.1 translation initiation factor IF-2 [Methanophagales archaeon]